MNVVVWGQTIENIENKETFFLKFSQKLKKEEISRNDWLQLQYFRKNPHTEEEEKRLLLLEAQFQRKIAKNPVAVVELLLPCFLEKKILKNGGKKTSKKGRKHFRSPNRPTSRKKKEIPYFPYEPFTRDRPRYAFGICDRTTLYWQWKLPMHFWRRNILKRSSPL